MRGKKVHIFLAMIWFAACSGGLAAAGPAQDPTMESRRRGADPNTAMIEGHVLLPSGQSANFNVKIILGDLTQPLNTLYTNKHAEFRFPNLSEGEYYVQALGDEKTYEPVTQRVRLARGQTYQLTLTLRKKEEIASRNKGGKTVSASDFDQLAPAAARKEYEQSVRLVGKGNVDQAIERLQRALAIYPDYVEARNDLGAQYLKLRRFDEAAEQFRLVLEKHPKYFDSRFNLGLVLIEKKNYAIAIEELRQAIAVDGARPEARLWLGVALLQTNDLAGAERELSKTVITGGTDFPAAHYYLAQVFMRREDSAGAAGELKAYLERAPKGEFAEESRVLLKRLAAKSPPAKR
jgi:tetratricopeptide (TPR) repeat protein